MAADEQELVYRIALTMVPNVGSVLAKNLVAYCGSAQQVFKTPKQKLLSVPDIGEVVAQSIRGFSDFEKAEKEMAFIHKHQLQCLYFTDEQYPHRLKQCNDAPVMLYWKGTTNLNHPRMVGIVGTRKATDYGKEMTRKLVEDLAVMDVVVVSGLAFGIDICAHNTALDNNIATVGVLAHGMNRIYPDVHKKSAARMLEHGGLLTEYTSFDEFTPHNFPSRNRIVAGMCDCLIVVESASKGGAVITANIANSYNRDVFAFPGRVGDKASAGCHFLIKTNRAALIESATDLCEAMNWSAEKAKQKKQLTLPVNLTTEQQQIFSVLQQGETAIDILTEKTQMRSSQLAEQLLLMEMEGWVVAKPGKVYKLVS